MIHGDWHDWWPVIYQAVALNALDPEKYPLHKNFWGYHRMFGRIPNAPFHEEILLAGPQPRLKDIQVSVLGGMGNLDSWLCRRFAYIKKLKPNPH